MIPQHPDRRDDMAHQIKEDGANFELTIDQLDEVAGGGFFSSIGHFISHEAHVVGHAVGDFFKNPAVATIAAGIILVGGIVTGAGGSTNMKLN
jgi:hypothetical protein